MLYIQKEIVFLGKSFKYNAVTFNRNFHDKKNQDFFRFIQCGKNKQQPILHKNLSGFELWPLSVTLGSIKSTLFPITPSGMMRQHVAIYKHTITDCTIAQFFYT